MGTHITRDGKDSERDSMLDALPAADYIFSINWKNIQIEFGKTNEYKEV